MKKEETINTLICLGFIGLVITLGLLGLNEFIAIGIGVLCLFGVIYIKQEYKKEGKKKD